MRQKKEKISQRKKRRKKSVREKEEKNQSVSQRKNEKKSVLNQTKCLTVHVENVLSGDLHFGCFFFCFVFISYDFLCLR